MGQITLDPLRLDDKEISELETVIRDLVVELDYAKKWGDEFDEKNTINDWVVFINMYASDAAKLEISDKNSKSQKNLEVRKKLIKAMGLCYNAIKHLDRGGHAPRHYGD